jgi:hypothetical protein
MPEDHFNLPWMSWKCSLVLESQAGGRALYATVGIWLAHQSAQSRIRI